MKRNNKAPKFTFPPMERMWNLKSSLKWNPPMPRVGDVMDCCLPILSDKFQTKG